MRPRFQLSLREAPWSAGLCTALIAATKHIRAVQSPALQGASRITSEGLVATERGLFVLGYTLEELLLVQECQGLFPSLKFHSSLG